MGKLFFLNEITHYWESHRSVLKVVMSHAIQKLWGSTIFAVMPVMAVFYFGGEQKAGLVMGAITGLQVFLFNPLAGQLVDKKGSLVSFHIGLWPQVIGSILFLIDQSVWSLLLFFVGFVFRWSFFSSEAYTLKNSSADEGGFIFGLREEAFALAALLGILLFPLFIFVSTWTWLPVITILFALLSGLFLINVKPDKIEREPIKLRSALNLWVTVRSALHFIRVNHRYPLFVVGSKLFEGLFYGAIWFLFPLHLSTLLQTSDGSLELGIYEIVTILLALLCGVVADRLDWRRLEWISWLLMLVMIWILPFWHSPLALVVLGFFIGISNNFFVAASYHALAKYDEDHEEDGQFNAFTEVLMNLGYMVAPVMCGFLYQAYGFQSSLLFITVTISALAIWMLVLCVQKR